MKKILFDFLNLYKREPLIMSILTWLLLLGSKLSIYATLLLIPYIINRKIKYQDDNILLFVILYSTSYSLFSLMNGYYDAAIGNVFFHSLFPPTFYLVGRCVASTQSRDTMILFLLIIVSYIALPVLKDVFNDIRTNQFINVSRRIVLENGIEAGSATILGLKVSLAVSCIGVIFGKLRGYHEMIISYLFLLVSIGGVICVLHLVNRTGLILSGVSILIVFILNLKYLPKINIFIMVLCVLLLTLFYIPQMIFVNEINDVYIARNETSGSEISSGGGRLDLWILGLNSLIDYPLGIPKVERSHYSHNFWLDTNINGGIFAFLFLVIVSIKHLKNSIAIIKKSKAGLLRSLFISINIGFFLTALVEPIMEGFQIYVFILFLFIGIIQEYKTSHIY